MTVETILAMGAGPELDKAVHTMALGRPGRAPAYSTKPETAIELVAQLPIGVGRVPQTADGYNPAKPFVAFVLARHKQLATWHTPMSVTAATLPMALSKMALIFTISPKERLPAVAGAIAPRLGVDVTVPALEPMPPRTTPKIPPTPGVATLPP